MNTRLMRGAAITVASAVLLTGCAAQGAPSSEGSTLAADPAPTDLDGVTLTMWNASTIQPGYDLLIEGFEKATGAKVEQTTFPDPFESNLLTKWGTGARPDILLFQSALGQFQKLNPTKNLFDLSNQEFIQNAEFGLADYAANVGGKSYALSLEGPSVNGLWYNKKVLEEAGVEDVPTDLDSLKETLETVHRALPDVAPLYEVGGDKWPTQLLPMMLWTDALKDGLLDELNTNEAEWTDESIVDSFTQYKALQGAGLLNENLTTATYAQQQAALLSGDAAFIAMGNYVVSDLIRQSSLEFVDETIGFTPFSRTTGTAQWGPPVSLMLPKTGDSKQELAALAFLQYVSGDAYQDFVDAQLQVPALGGFSTPDGIPAPVVTAFESLNDRGYSPQFAADFGDLPTLMSELINAQKTPEDVAKALQATWARSGAAIGLPGF